MSVKKISLGVVLGLLAQLLLGFALIGSISTAQAAPGPKDAGKVGPANTGNIVFSLNQDSDLAGVVSTFQLINVTSLAPLQYSGTPHGDAVSVAGNMNLDSRVAAADPDYMLSVQENRISFSYDSASVITGTNTTSQEALAQYQNQYAWSATNLSAIRSRTQGQGITIAVLDTGVDYTHPDLQGHLANNGYSPIDGGDGMDANGHGTFVAGIIAYVAPQAKILPIRVLDANGQGSLSSIIKGSQYAILHGATVLSESFSTTTSLKTLNDLVNQATKTYGVTFVAAAGNDNSTTPTYPAALDAVVGVAATDQTNCKASFSNYGDNFVALAAPGTNIYSTFLNGGYGVASGTSFSTPIVAGAAALVKSLHSNNNGTQIANTLKNAITNIPGSCHDTGVHGLLNFGRIN